jgi:DNA-binding XRE family transcriptional regulator
MVTIRNLGHLGTPEPYRYSAMDLGVPERETYGHKLRRLRLELALTQAEVARMVDCSKETISAWERGRLQGNSAEAAEIPRRAIELLGRRLKSKQRRDGLDSVSGVARRRAKPGVVDESLVPLPQRRLRRG